MKVINVSGWGHQMVVHDAKKFVPGKVPRNRPDGVRSMLERARMGIQHRMSRQHLPRYLDEIGFQCRSRARPAPARPSSSFVIPKR